MIKKMESKEYALGVERMDKAVGEAGRPLMLCGARLYIIT